MKNTIINVYGHEGPFDYVVFFIGKDGAPVFLLNRTEELAQEFIQLLATSAIKEYEVFKRLPRLNQKWLIAD